MRAIIITQPGGPEVLQMVERPVPLHNDNEVLIKVAAAGINRPDIFQRKGNYPPPVDASSDIPGLEIAGTIIAVGKDASRWQIGDKVCALVAGGGYAEYCNVPAGQCLPVPQNFTFTEAASLPETFFTVYSNVFNDGFLKPDDSILVHGGSGGIGSTAIQMAKALGIKVYTTAGSEEKCAFCERLGANGAINYKTENFADAIKKFTNGEGVNLILDSIGGNYTSLNLGSLANDGRLIIINAVKGRYAEVDLSLIMRKRLMITGATLRPRSVAFKAQIARRLEERIWPLLTSGEIKPVVFDTFRAEEAAKAHELIEAGNHMGKIVLEF